MGRILNHGSDIEVVSKWANLEAAVNALGGTVPRTLLINEDTTAFQPADTSQAFTVPDNITLEFVRGNKIILQGNGNFLVIHGTIQAGRYQIFEHNNSETRIGYAAEPWTNRVAEVYPEWWADNVDPGQTDMRPALRMACRSLKGGGTVSLASQVYRVNTTIAEPLNGIRIAGSNSQGESVGNGLVHTSRASTIQWGGADGDGPVIDLTAGHGCILENLEINCGQLDGLGWANIGIEFSGGEQNVRFDNLHIVGASDISIAFGRVGAPITTVQHFVAVNVRINSRDGGTAAIYVNSSASENLTFYGLHCFVPNGYQETPLLGTPHIFVDIGEVVVYSFNSGGGSPERDIISDPGDIYITEDYAVRVDAGSSIRINNWSSEDRLPGPYFGSAVGGKPSSIINAEFRAANAGHVDHPALIRWGSSSTSTMLILQGIQIEDSGSVPTPGGDVQIGGQSVAIVDGITWTDGIYGDVTIVGAAGTAMVRDKDGVLLRRNDTPVRFRMFEVGGDLAFDVQGTDLKLYENRSGPEVAVRVSGLNRGGVVDFRAVNSDPSDVDVNRGQLYVKDVEGLPELHYVDSAETPTQITSNGGIAPGSVFNPPVVIDSGNGDDDTLIVHGDITISGNLSRLVWATDGDGGIGAGSSAGRPNDIFAANRLVAPNLQTSTAVTGSFRIDYSTDMSNVGNSCNLWTASNNDEITLQHRSVDNAAGQRAVVSVWKHDSSDHVLGYIHGFGWSNASTNLEMIAGFTGSGLNMISSESTPAYLLWTGDGTGDIGRSDGQRPAVVYAENKFVAGSGVIAEAGDMEVTQSGYGIVLSSPDGTRYRLQIDNAGGIITTAI